MKRAYKLMKIDDNGKLRFPFCDTSKDITIGEWMVAEDKSIDIGNGKRKTPLVFRGGTKGLAVARPGFHCTDIPYAPHIGVGGIPSRHEMIGSRDVWVKITIVDDVDYQEDANRNGMNVNGKMNAVKCDIRSHVPFNGTYRYKTNPNMKGTWIIAGTIRIDRILNDNEVSMILHDNGISPMPRENGSIPFRTWRLWNKKNKSTEKGA